MHLTVHKIEKVVDRVIPYLLIGLVVVIVLEIFAYEQIQPYRALITLFDGMVLLFFAADLWFKAQRVKNFREFVKRYWLDMLAIVPLILVLRVVEVAHLSRVVRAGEGSLAKIGIDEQAAAILKDAARASKLTRTTRMVRLLRVIGRSPQFLKIVPYFEAPTGKHHPHERRKHARAMAPR